MLPVLGRSRVWRPLSVAEDMLRPVVDQIVSTVGNQIAMLTHQFLKWPREVPPPPVERRSHNVVENVHCILLRWNTISADQLSNERINIIAAHPTDLLAIGGDGVLLRFGGEGAG